MHGRKNIKCGEAVYCGYQNVAVKIIFKNSLNIFYTQPVPTFWTHSMNIQLNQMMRMFHYKCMAG